MAKPVNMMEWLESIKVANPGLQRQAVMLDMLDSTDDSDINFDHSRIIEKFYGDDLKAMMDQADKNLGLLPTNLCDNSELQEIYRKAIDSVATK